MTHILAHTQISKHSSNGNMCFLLHSLSAYIHLFVSIINRRETLLLRASSRIGSNVTATTSLDALLCTGSTMRYNVLEQLCTGSTMPYNVLEQCCTGTAMSYARFNRFLQQYLTHTPLCSELNHCDSHTLTTGGSCSRQNSYCSNFEHLLCFCIYRLK